MLELRRAHARPHRVVGRVGRFRSGGVISGQDSGDLDLRLVVVGGFVFEGFLGLAGD